MNNLITDVPSVLVGNAHDARVATGVTVAVFARGVYEATALPFAKAVPDWRSTHGRR